MPLSDQRRGQPRDRPQLRHVRQPLVVVIEREVDVQAPVRGGRDARIESTFEIDDGVDPVPRHGGPVLDCCRDEQPPVVVDLEQVHRSLTYPTTSYLSDYLTHLPPTLS